GNRFNMDAQLDNFANTRSYIISSIACYFIIMGSDDFLDNYFTRIVSIPKQMLVSQEMFVNSMISGFRLHLTRLYEMDARKIVVANVGPVGCIPLGRTLNYKSWYTAGDSCISAMNNAARLFNKKLKSLIIELNSNLVGSKFVYVDTYSDYKTACRKLLPDPPRGLHSPAPLVCKDQSKYVFWDFAHPTEATYVIFAKKELEDRDSTFLHTRIQ
ncbi:hypothetical protein MKX01_024681, partial [Papaver californicum]